MPFLRNNKKEKYIKTNAKEKSVNINEKTEEKSDIWDMGESLIEVKEEGENIKENNKGFIIRPEDFGPLKDLVLDNKITDIDFNGQDLWTIDQSNRKVKRTEIEVNPGFIRRLAQNIANAEAKEFNQQFPSLEAETEDLRISIVHNSIAQTGTSVCIRKTPVVQRIIEKEAISNGYFTRETLSLLVNCIKAHMNIIICGEPRAGKTECAKLISGYIPSNERVITIEDVQEWHYKTLHPDSDCIEMKVNKVFDYSKGIIASLKQNPQWIMIAETRGEEVKNLLQGFTTGVKGITTLHTDDVQKIPKRIVNMANDPITADRTEDNVYEFVDVGVYISMHPDGQGGQVRMIDQIGFFGYDDNNPIESKRRECILVLNTGHWFRNDLPEKIQKKFRNANIENPLQNDEVDRRLAKQGYEFESEGKSVHKLIYDISGQAEAKRKLEEKLKKEEKARENTAEFGLEDFEDSYNGAKTNILKQ